MTEDKAAAALRHERWKQDRLRCYRDIETILAAKRCGLGTLGDWWSSAEAFPFRQLDHFQTFRTKKGLFVFDNPYPPRTGGLPIPRSMSFYIAEECSPRLLVPKGSFVDLEYIRDLLMLAEFKGNYVMTENYDRWK
jgi:hypothetical protein